VRSVVRVHPDPPISIYILLVKMNVGILWRQSSIIIFLEY
jgi:hypothetical protein